MSALRALRKLVLGETWTLPLGLAAVVLVLAIVVRPLDRVAFERLGGFALLAGVLVVLVLSVALGARRR